VFTLIVLALTSCVPFAVTLTPPDPTGPYAPDVALVVPDRLENARAPLMPTPMPA